MFGPRSCDYKTISLLGECCNKVGVVHLAKHVPSGEMVAIKKFNMENAYGEAPLIQKEIILTRQLQHPNILIYYLAFVTGPEIYVISPLMGYRSCRDLLNTHFTCGFTENAIALILHDVVDALDYVHKRGLIHRSVKAGHVLIADNGRAYLTGFRYTCPIVTNGKWQKRIHNFPINAMKNLKWLSPEILEQNLQGYNEKSDIYSVGMLISELANGSEPYARFANILMLTEKVRGATPQLYDCTTLTGEENDVHGDSVMTSLLRKQASRRFTEGLHQITALCLQREPNHRPTSSQLLTHPYFKVNRRECLPELLKPALSLSDMVAWNYDDVEPINNLDKLIEDENSEYDWNF